MKRHESDGYRARGLTGGHYLSTRGTTLEEIRQEIDVSNARAILKGYEAESWIITHWEHYVWYDDNDMFSKSENYEQAIEIYPAEEGVSKMFYIVDAKAEGNEWTVDKAENVEDVVRIAKEHWDSLTSHDKKRSDVTIRLYTHDIKDENCTCYDYDTIRWRDEDDQ